MGQCNSGEVEQCRKRIRFNSAENENFVQQCRKFEHIKCGNQKLNGYCLQSSMTLLEFERENLQFRRFGAKIVV